MTIHWILEDQEYPLCSLFLTRGRFNLKAIVTYFQKVFKTEDGGIDFFET